MRSTERLAATLRDSREEANLYKKLATLIEDVPLRESLEDLRWKGAPRKELARWCQSIGMDPARMAPPKYDDD